MQSIDVGRIRSNNLKIISKGARTPDRIGHPSRCDYKQLKTVTKKGGVAVDYQMSDCLASVVPTWEARSRLGKPAYTNLHFPAYPTLLDGKGATRLPAAGECQREGKMGMSMRRTIGISLACLVTGACAIDKTPEEESISHYPGETADLPQGNGETPTG